jgi:hypothetical protein
MNTRGAIDRLGQVAQLRRLTGTGSNQTWHEVSLRVFARQFRAQEIVAGSSLQQGDRQVIAHASEIDAAQWPAPPRRDDKLLLEGRLLNVQSVETVRVGERVERYNMVCRG